MSTSTAGHQAPDGPAPHLSPAGPISKSRSMRPDYCFSRVTDIPPAWIASLGIRGLLIDMDNTLTRWENLQVPAEELEWLAAVNAAGLRTRLLTNGLAHKRTAVTGQIGIACVNTALFKPLPLAFTLGVRELELAPEEVMMIGDSVFTDIAGANHAGIWSCLVEPLSRVDFFGSKFYRMLESGARLRRPLHQHCDYRKDGLRRLSYGS